MWQFTCETYRRASLVNSGFLSYYVIYNVTGFNMRRVTIAEIIKLTPKKANFVVEYIKDFAPRRAAEASGFSADHGYRLLAEDEVSEAIEYIVQQRLK